MISPGKTQIIISDVSLINWYSGKAIRFSVGLAIGDSGGDFYIVQQGCLAWRNRFQEIEWSLPVYNTKGSRIRRYAGWCSPRVYEEVRRFLELRFGNKLKWVKRPNKKSERLSLDEGEEIIEFASSGRAGPTEESEGICGTEKQGSEREDSIAAITGEWKDSD